MGKRGSTLVIPFICAVIALVFLLVILNNLNVKNFTGYTTTTTCVGTPVSTFCSGLSLADCAIFSSYCTSQGTLCSGSGPTTCSSLTNTQCSKSQQLNLGCTLSTQTTDTVGANGLVSYYSFDAYVRNTWLYDLIANHDATCVSGKCPVPFTSGWRGVIDNQGTLAAVGNATDFDGVDDYLDYGNNSFNNYGNGTIAFWVKTDDNKQNQTIFMASNLASTADYLEVIINDAWTSYHGIKVYSRSSIGGNWLMYTHPKLIIDWTKFTHVAIVQDGVKPALYINGEKLPEGTVNGVMFSSGTTNKGAWFDDVTGTQISYFSGKFARKSQEGSFFKGKLDELRIYNTNVSADVILGLAGGTKCWWPASETNQYNNGVTTGFAEDNALLNMSTYIEKSLLCYKKHWYTPDATRRNGDWADIKDYIILNKTANEKIGIWTATAANPAIQQYSPYWNLTANCLWPPNAANPDGYANNNELLYVIKIGGQAVTPYFEKSLLCYNGVWYTPDSTRRLGDWGTWNASIFLNVTGDKVGSWTAMAIDTDIIPPQYSPYWKIVGTTPTTTCNDSDLGSNYFVAGVTAINEGEINYSDTCSNTNTLTEYSCNADGTLKTETVLCTLGGCSNGACALPEGGAFCPSIEGKSKVPPKTRLNVTNGKCIGGNFSCASVPVANCPRGLCTILGYPGENASCAGRSDAPCAALSAGVCSQITGCSVVPFIKYCDPLTLTYLNVKPNGDSCLNDYECATQTCIDGKCTSLRAEIEIQGKLIKEIWCWIVGFIPGGQTQVECRTTYQLS
jgi:hypothetical protein